MFKGDRIIVPHRLRPEILQRIHAAHLGIEKCKARARGAVFWPGIYSAIDELVSKCSTCQQLNEGEPVRMKRGRDWTPAVVVQQHQTPRSYIVATPDGTQMRRNRFHLQPTKEEAFPAPSPDKTVLELPR